MTFKIKLVSRYTNLRKPAFTGSANTLKSLGYNKTKFMWHDQKSGKQDGSVVADFDKRDQIDPLGINEDSKPSKNSTVKDFELATADEILGSLNSKQESPLSIGTNVSKLDQLTGSKTASKEDTLLPWQREDDGGSDMQKAFAGLYDSTLANGGDSKSGTESTEKRVEGGSVVDFIKNSFWAAVGTYLGVKAGNAVEAAGVGSSTVKEIASNGPGAYISAFQVGHSENKEDSLLDSSASLLVGAVNPILGLAVAIGLAGENEMQQEAMQTSQNICLALAGTAHGGSRDNCLNWGPNGKPWSAEMMEAVRDYLYNGKDPAKIAKEQWENKDPLINPGANQNNDAGSAQADDWFTNQRGAICPIDETIIDPFEMKRTFIADPSLGFLINPGEGGNNGGEGGLDEGGDPFSKNLFGQPSDSSDGTTTLF